jgi:hypothetical protein
MVIATSRILNTPQRRRSGGDGTGTNPRMGIQRLQTFFHGVQQIYPVKGLGKELALSQGLFQMKHKTNVPGFEKDPRLFTFSPF